MFGPNRSQKGQLLDNDGLPLPPRPSPQEVTPDNAALSAGLRRRIKAIQRRLGQLSNDIATTEADHLGRVATRARMERAALTLALSMIKRHPQLAEEILAEHTVSR